MVGALCPEEAARSPGVYAQAQANPGDGALLPVLVQLLIDLEHGWGMPRSNQLAYVEETTSEILFPANILVTASC